MRLVTSNPMRALGLSVAALSLAVLAPGRARLQGQAAPTWAKDIAPWVHSHCTPCHSEGGHAPFALGSYQDVARRSELVRQEVLSLKMPPCSAESDFEPFCTEPPLDDAQRLALQRWMQAGMPEGEGAPAAPVVKRGWTLGKPDLVLRPKTPEMPHEGNPVWRAVVVDPQNTKPLRLRAFEVVPHAPDALRHSLLAVVSKDEARTEWATNGTLEKSASRLIGSWAPGYRAWRLPKGAVVTLQPGEKLVLQLLLVPTGKAETPDVELGLYLSDEKGAKEAKWIELGVENFTIKPFDELTLTDGTTLERDVDVLAVVPEARFFAYSVTVSAETQDGPKRVLMRSVKWSPYWVGNYSFTKPVRLKKGTNLISEVAYENQRHSPINEGNNPRQVWSGPGLDQEVCRTHVLVVER